MLRAGACSNRTMCVHEKMAVLYLESYGLGEEIPPEREMEVPDVGEAIRHVDEMLEMDTGQIDVERVSKEPISYVSNMRKTFFSCESDDDALIPVLSCELKNVELRKSGTESLYVGIDRKRTCRGFVNEMDVRELASTS